MYPTAPFSSLVSLKGGIPLIVGGNTFGPGAAAEVYDPATGSWTTVKPALVSTGTDGAIDTAITRLLDNRVLASGGKPQVYTPAG